MLYEGIFEFVQRADFLGNIINGLPIIGPLRVQFMNAGRERLTMILGDQLVKFLGEYSASAAEVRAGPGRGCDRAQRTNGWHSTAERQPRATSQRHVADPWLPAVQRRPEHPSARRQGAANFALNEENRPYFRRARRKLGKKLLQTPISELLALSEIEMAILRDSVWTAIQEFRLPNEVPRRLGPTRPPWARTLGIEAIPSPSMPQPQSPNAVPNRASNRVRGRRACSMRFTPSLAPSPSRSCCPHRVRRALQTRVLQRR